MTDQIENRLQILLPEEKVQIARANEALDSAYIENTPEFEIEGRDEAIVDLFTDLHHLCTDYNFNIDELWRIAKDHYHAESERDQP